MMDADLVLQPSTDPCARNPPVNLHAPVPDPVTTLTTLAAVDTGDLAVMLTAEAAATGQEDQGTAIVCPIATTGTQRQTTTGLITTRQNPI